MLFGSRKSVKLQVAGMTCGHCAASVIKALEGVEGVKKAKASVSKGTAEAFLSTDVPREILLKAVQEAGYEASAP